jgi:hypothetical protein
VLDTAKAPLEMMIGAACWHNRLDEEARQHCEASGYTDHKARMTIEAHINQCSEHASKAALYLHPKLDLHPKLAQTDAKMLDQGGLTVNSVQTSEESQ